MHFIRLCNQELQLTCHGALFRLLKKDLGCAPYLNGGETCISFEFNLIPAHIASPIASTAFRDS